MFLIGTICQILLSILKFGPYSDNFTLRVMKLSSLHIFRFCYHLQMFYSKYS